MSTVQNLVSKGVKRGVPEYTAFGIADYVMNGTRTGGFLKAVLSNDLMGSYKKADLENREAMFSIVMFIYNDCPGRCWGSKKAYNNWEGLK